MKIFLNLIAIAILFVFQISLAEFQFLPSIPNLLLVFLCISLLYFKINEVFILAIFAGLLLDFFSGIPDGILVLSTLTALLGANYLSQLIFTERFNEFIIFFHVIFASIIFFLVTLLSTQILGQFDLSYAVGWSSIFSIKFGSGVILNLISLYFVYLYWNLSTKIQNRFLPRHESI